MCEYTATLNTSTYASVCFFIYSWVLISPWPDQEGNKLGSMSRTNVISTTSRRDMSSSPPPLPREARRRRKFTPFGRKQYLVSFLVGLRTYQHPCTAYSGHCYIPGFFHVDKAAETWCWPYSYTVCLPTVHRDTFTFHLFVMNCGELPLLFPSVTFHP